MASFTSPLLRVASAIPRRARACCASAAALLVVLALSAAPATGAPLPSTLVHTIDTSRWSPASPDPSGLAYDTARDRLLVTDGEVDEMSIYSGANYYEASRGGTLLRTSTTVPFSNEPTGIAVDTGRAFITDDDRQRVFQVALGSNGIFDSTDSTTSFSTSGFGGGIDPEGIAYDSAGDRLFIAGGEGNGIYQVSAVDGVFGNGNDLVQRFSSTNVGVTDPESIEFDPATGTLYTIGSSGDKIVQTTTSGALVSEIDVSQVPLVAPSALIYAPSSDDPAKKSFYIADRKVDNDNHPTENDGAIYEVRAGGGGTPPPTGDVRISASADDAEEAGSGSVALTSSDLEFVTDGSTTQNVGMRFTGLSIPAGATITRAYIQFVADESQSEATNLVFAAQASDSAPTFTTTAFNVSSRPRTAATTAWSPAAWTAGQSGLDQRTPDLTPVVQEVVSRPGWASGNAMAFIVSGSGHRTAVAFDGSAANAPVLHVEYTTGSSANQPPVVSAGPDQTITLPNSAFLDGTVTDDGRPNPTPTTTWSRVSGPGTVTFADPSAVDTQASFSTAGTYVLRLTAFDGELSAADDTTVVVNDAPSGILLSARGYKVKGKQRVDLTWSGAAGANVDVFRNDAKLVTTANDGAYTDNINKNGSGSYRYRVCEAGTSTCSAEVLVTFG
jgi:hypothetical protein